MSFVTRLSRPPLCASMHPGEARAAIETLVARGLLGESKMRALVLSFLVTACSTEPCSGLGCPGGGESLEVYLEVIDADGGADVSSPTFETDAGVVNAECTGALDAGAPCRQWAFEVGLSVQQITVSAPGFTPANVALAEQDPEINQCCFDGLRMATVILTEAP